MTRMGDTYKERDRDVLEMVKEDGKVKNYKGFVAGVFSGVAKLTGQYSPFVVSL